MLSNKVKIAYSDEYVLTLDKEHKFPIDKYWMIPQSLSGEKVISTLQRKTIFRFLFRWAAVIQKI